MMNIKEIKTVCNIDLKPYNTLRLSSAADIAYFPKNKEELCYLMNEIKNPIIIGGGSNIIFASDKFRKIAIIPQYLI